jgi:hypothetical protein
VPLYAARIADLSLAPGGSVRVQCIARLGLHLERALLHTERFGQLHHRASYDAFCAPCAEPVIGNSRLGEDEILSISPGGDDVIAGFGATKSDGLGDQLFQATS